MSYKIAIKKHGLNTISNGLIIVITYLKNMGKTLISW